MYHHTTYRQQRKIRIHCLDFCCHTCSQRCGCTGCIKWFQWFCQICTGRNQAQIRSCCSLQNRMISYITAFHNNLGLIKTISPTPGGSWHRRDSSRCSQRLISIISNNSLLSISSYGQCIPSLCRTFNNISFTRFYIIWSVYFCSFNISRRNDYQTITIPSIVYTFI